MRQARELPSIPQPLSPKKGERGVRPRCPRVCSRLPSPYLGEGTGVRAERMWGLTKKPSSLLFEMTISGNF